MTGCPSPGRRRVVVIGSGVAGLTAAYLLQRTADVTLFEGDARLGGHAHTHDVTTSDGSIAVDSGFIVHNVATYPSLLRLFAELGIATQPAQMSMSVRCRGCGLQFAGARGPSGVFAQPVNALRPAFLSMLVEVPRFHRLARALLAARPDGHEATLGEFLADHRFSRYFIRHYATPIVSAVWSCSAGTVTEYPARYLFAFLANHGMLNVARNAGWRTVTGGSRRYVEAIAARLTSVRTSTPVRALARHADGVTVYDGSGQAQEFAGAVVATHADQALALLADAAPMEKAVLGSFRYSVNETVMHSDPSVLPSRRGARASWNIDLPSCQPTCAPVRISYDMRRLQGISAPVVVTLNDAGSIGDDRVYARMRYEHPVYTPEVLAAQRRLPELSNGFCAFAGAYHGWGFHEDGCRSGVTAAALLGAPW